MNKSAIRILVLDDESFMLKLLGHMLAGLGFTSVTTCESGRCCAGVGRQPQSTRPNLILLDLQMPEMDGIEFVRKLVEHNYTGNLILVSGEDERVLQMAEKLIQAHRITVLGHLNKPVSVARLSELMEKSVHMHKLPRNRQRRPIAQTNCAPPSTPVNSSITTSPRWRSATGAISRRGDAGALASSGGRDGIPRPVHRRR